MRLSTILVASATIYFTATSVYAIPIPSCEGDQGDCATPKNRSVLSPNSQINLAAIVDPGKDAQGNPSGDMLTSFQSSFRRRNNVKRDKPPPSGPLSGRIGAVSPSVTTFTTPVTALTGGSTTSLGTTLVGAQGLVPSVGPKDTDVAAKVTDAQTNAQAVAVGVETLPKVLDTPAPPKQAK